MANDAEGKPIHVGATVIVAHHLYNSRSVAQRAIVTEVLDDKIKVEYVITRQGGKHTFKALDKVIVI